MLRILTVGGCLWLLGYVAFTDGHVAIADEVAKKAAVGKPAPDFTVTGIDGNEFKLSQKTAPGKNVVLMFSRAHW